MKTNTGISMQIWSFFALVRVQNIVLLIIAFILTAKYFFVPQRSLLQLLTDTEFVALLLATIFSIAGGYIINAFYDVSKDLINRPQKTILEQQLPQTKRLYLYFTLNFLSVAAALLISWRAAAFFGFYIFLIWFYSHKIQKVPVINNLWLTVLSIFPFFSIFLYFKSFDIFIFWHAVFLFLILLIKNLLKDFIKLKGDLAQGKPTIPLLYGEKKAKRIILFISILTIIPIYFLLKSPYIGLMKYYFYFTITFYGIGFYFFYFQNKFDQIFYFLVRLLLAIGVLAIAFVKH